MADPMKKQIPQTSTAATNGSPSPAGPQPRAPLALVPRRIKWTHWLIVGIYALVGVEGFRFLIVYCVNHSKFVALFSQPNIANLSPGSMQVTALAYSLKNNFPEVAEILRAHGAK